MRRWLYDHIRWAYRVHTFFINYFRDHTHVYPTGTRRGQWSDHTERLWYAMTWAFLDFIEKEFTEYISHLNENERWYSPLTKVGMYENVMTALRLEEECGRHQEEAAKKAREVYRYLKRTRPRLVNIVDTYQDLGWRCSNKPSTMHYYRRANKYETMLHDLDQKCLHNIVDLRPWMWT